jgi:hypothetical protein
MSDERHPSPADEAKRLYDESETRTARAFEQLVARDSFGELLAKMTENVVALTRIGNDAFDLVLRNLRLAGRQDVIRLSRQLSRTEDKLELVLQEVERLREEQRSPRGRGGNASSRSSNGRGRSGSTKARSGGSSS